MDTNIQVKPGDILLLRSRGARGRGTLLAQAIARQGRERYTRVAVVVNDELVADAMPQRGVQLRRWRDILDRYDLAASCLARHDRLAAEPDASALVLQRASHFYRQRYDVKALVRDDDGTPLGELCSRFIGALYGDLGLRQQHAEGAWPHDVDAHTRHGDWRQYPLTRHASPALPSLAHWHALPGSVPASLLRNLQWRRAVSDYARKLDGLQRAVAQATQDLPKLSARQPWQDAAEGPATGGGAMLDGWHHLFLAGGGLASGRAWLERRFAAHAGQLLARLHDLHDALAVFFELAPRARLMERMPDFPPLAEQLLAWGDALCDDELMDEVLLRVQNYPLLHEELMELDEGSDDESVALGANSLVALSEADLVRLDWTGGQRCAVMKHLIR